MLEAPSAKIVWVLGAGFSAPLGGPLLSKMLTKASIDDVRACYGGEERLWNDAAEAVRYIYHWGQNWPEGALDDQRGRWPGQKAWPDAEVFLDFLDTAARTDGGPAAIRLTAILQHRGPGGGSAVRLTANELRWAARRWLAAECCAFLKEADTKEETWQPYTDWALSLRANDTIVTFNYDRVVEMTAANHVMVVRPGHEDDLNVARHADCCAVLKLHGSVDWRVARATNGVIVSIEKDPAFAVSCVDDELAIATPGPSKADTARQYRALWEAAETALREADAIVFMGYRFPPGDADARGRLLGAIETSRAKHVTAHVVLGPLGDDSRRLEALLRFVLNTPPRFESGPVGSLASTFAIRAHSLYAQDFLTVAKVHHLL
jgi:hypothetical protein